MTRKKLLAVNSRYVKVLRQRIVQGPIQINVKDDLPKVSAASITPPSYFTPSTDVPVTMGDWVWLVGSLDPWDELLPG